MVKKLKAQLKEEEKQLASAVRTSAQQIWQAGLGAFAKAQEEGGRVFSKLVKEGTAFQKRAEDKVSGVGDTVGKIADGVSQQASGSWDKLEQVFEERVARALATIGVPTRKELQALNKRIDQLNKALAELSGAQGDKAAKPVKVKTVVAKPARVKTAAVKPAAQAAEKAAVKPAPKAKPPAKAAAPTSIAKKPAVSKPAPAKAKAAGATS